MLLWPAIDRNLGSSYLRLLQATRQVLIDGDYGRISPPLRSLRGVVKKLLLLRLWSKAEKVLPSTTGGRTEAWCRCRAEARRWSEIINFMVE